MPIHENPGSLNKAELVEAYDLLAREHQDQSATLATTIADLDTTRENLIASQANAEDLGDRLSDSIPTAEHTAAIAMKEDDIGALRATIQSMKDNGSEPMTFPLMNVENPAATIDVVIAKVARLYNPTWTADAPLPESAAYVHSIIEAFGLTKCDKDDIANAREVRALSALIGGYLTDGLYQQMPETPRRLAAVPTHITARVAAEAIAPLKGYCLSSYQILCKAMGLADATNLDAPAQAIEQSTLDRALHDLEVATKRGNQAMIARNYIVQLATEQPLLA